MLLQLDEDETWALLSLFVSRVADEVPMSDKDRATIRRWRSDKMKASSPAMRELTLKVNEDLQRAIKGKERSKIRKPDWIGM
jgi:hypothetical protein